MESMASQLAREYNNFRIFNNIAISKWHASCTLHAANALRTSFLAVYSRLQITDLCHQMRVELSILRDARLRCYAGRRGACIVWEGIGLGHLPRLVISNLVCCMATEIITKPNSDLSSNDNAIQSEVNHSH